MKNKTWRGECLLIFLLVDLCQIKENKGETKYQLVEKASSK